MSQENNQDHKCLGKHKRQLLPLVAWFIENKRALPWRDNPTPYGVWISEVMLQQTQVAVVIPYYTRWMERFPDILSLADAEISEVIKLWEGLGYYARGRRLHRAAQYLVEHHGGKLPSDRASLEKVPGLGPYTVGAILSFAFHQRSLAVDGNVMRVLSRYRVIEEEIGSRRARDRAHDHLEELLPEDSPWVAMEALIELGALVCTKSPKCFACPLREDCLGLQKGIADLLPRKKKPREIVQLVREVFVFLKQSPSGMEVLVRQEEEGKVMGGLYEFPYQEATEKHPAWSFFDLPPRFYKELPRIKHSFTSFRVTLSPYVFYVDERPFVPGYQWCRLTEARGRPFSSGHRRVLQLLNDM